MGNKGFTLVELLSALVILSLVVGLGIGVFNFNMKNIKEKTEEVFIDTLKDAVDMYLSSELGSLKISDVCGNKLEKMHSSSIDVYKVTKNDGSKVKFSDIINSSYKPISLSDFVNPANKGLDGKYECNINAEINVYRDDDFVYYYSIDKSGLGCLNNIGNGYDMVISNLPEGFSC